MLFVNVLVAALLLGSARVISAGEDAAAAAVTEPETPPVIHNVRKTKDAATRNLEKWGSVEMIGSGKVAIATASDLFARVASRSNSFALRSVCRSTNSSRPSLGGGFTARRRNLSWLSPWTPAATFLQNPRKVASCMQRAAAAPFRTRCGSLHVVSIAHAFGRASDDLTDVQG